MAGHSHWKQIKEQKGTADQKRGVVFSKLLKAISAAAASEPNPEFNPRLRTTIEKAKQYHVPQDNIEKAVKKAKEQGELEEIIIEIYGPAGTAILIKAITNNKNRTIQEIKTLIKDYGGKLGNPGSVLWIFEQINESDIMEWRPKFAQKISGEDQKKLEELIQALENHEDVQKIYHNTSLVISD